MRIADVSAFYTPAGGGVRTYVDAKLKAASRLGHEIVMVVPGATRETIRRGPGAILVSVPAPPMPLDRRYRYFDDERALHAVLDEWRPDHVEASSPWSSATMVGRWQGAASRSLMMHADPLAAHAYRWLSGLVTTARIDGWFAWFWRHLRGLGQMFDLVVCANRQFAERLSEGGVAKVETIPMGVEAGVFGPAQRSPALRSAVLRSLGLDEEATLLIGVGRLSAEKRWPMVLHAVDAAARHSPVGLLLVGEGRQRARLEALAGRLATCNVLPRIEDRQELARFIASADALVHGCEAETFCLVAAEARASGIPLIVPDRGAALDLVLPGSGATYVAGSEQSLTKAIGEFVARGPELQRAAAARASRIRTMDEHFAALFARYEQFAEYGPPIAASTG